MIYIQNSQWLSLNNWWQQVFQKFVVGNGTCFLFLFLTLKNWMPASQYSYCVSDSKRSLLKWKYSLFSDEVIFLTFLKLVFNFEFISFFYALHAIHQPILLSMFENMYWIDCFLPCQLLSFNWWQTTVILHLDSWGSLLIGFSVSLLPCDSWFSK